MAFEIVEEQKENEADKNLQDFIQKADIDVKSDSDNDKAARITLEKF